MKPKNGSEKSSTSLVEARQWVDATVANVQTELNLDHRELSTVLLETRDTLLLNGSVPEWFGEAETERYTEMVRD